MNRHTLIRAAAGCGKTTELARRYVGFVADGISVRDAIAITFTRRAAAELVERVTTALRACLDGEVGAQARDALGPAWPRYEEVLPSDPEIALTALAELPSAPIGTTDSFVHSLLSEFALDAGVPLPDGDLALIDVPIRPASGVSDALERAARRILDPPDGSQDPDVVFLSKYFSLDEILRWLCHVGHYDHLPAATTSGVLDVLASELDGVYRDLDWVTRWEIQNPEDLDEIRNQLHRQTNTAGQFAVDAVARWLASDLKGPAPRELVPFSAHIRARRAALRELKALMHQRAFHAGPADLRLQEVLDTLRPPFHRPECVRLSDQIQGARERLRRRVAQAGLRAAAEAGELGHDALTEAAIALCGQTDSPVQGRFHALLVDEVQDASPAQLRLYRAIGDLPGVRTAFVGDSRQSIYLFRGAEPSGFESLVEAALDPQHALVDLVQNHRSHRTLVGAQRALFAALESPMRAQGYRPVEDLSRLTHSPATDSRALPPDHPASPAPVHICLPLEEETVRDYAMNERALHHFVARVRAAWNEPEHADDTAVVLCPTWNAAQHAARLIRAWGDRADLAFVEGGGRWLGSRVADDVRMLLRALTDPTDELAWLGVWKLPIVGLTDGALARIRTGVGIGVLDAAGTVQAAPHWFTQTSRLVDADRLLEPHEPMDIRAFERAAPVLRRARNDLGTRDMAGALEEIAAALDWRMLLAASPDGDEGVAVLDVMIDMVRTLETEGASFDVIPSLLDGESADQPHIRLTRPRQSFRCTTSHQAKGLDWDHVCIASPGRPGRLQEDHSEPTTAWMDLHGKPHRLVGLKFDPHGGLTPFKDPAGRLASRIRRFRTEEECARLAYVGITRARRSVTFGLANGGNQSRLQQLLTQAWTPANLSDEGVHWLRPPQPETQTRHGTGWATIAETPASPPSPATARTWSVRQPSSFAAHLDLESRRHEAETTAQRVVLGNGLHVGREDVQPPQALDLHASQWGDLAHGWFAHWAFSGPAAQDDADSWLKRAWHLDAPQVAGWLVGISEGIARAGGPLWELVTHPDTHLAFEQPLVGIAGQRDDLLLSGRIDLLARRGGVHTIIDFKAGERCPTGVDDLVDRAGLKTYGPQLEAYRVALERAGLEVDRVGLWFVRTGTQVIW